jgi:tRNA/rRNA methyltransferase
MNLGQAVAVTLYELVRDGGWKEVGGREQRAASTAEVDRLTGLLWEALGESGYVEERVAGSTELKLRRLVRRMGLGQRDAVQWQGMIRQILWKMRNR